MDSLLEIGRYVRTPHYCVRIQTPTTRNRRKTGRLKREMYAAISGFLTGLSLILAIGAQNAFVLRQGLTGEHVFWLCLFCAFSDAVLISIGVSGFGALVAISPESTRYMALAGAAFLFTYGFFRFRAAWAGVHEISSVAESRTLGTTIALAAVFTWANPHVYLDTVMLIGAVSTGFPGIETWLFGGGAIVASFVFFFTLGYGARLLAPIMQSPRAWRVLDTVIGITMWWLATALVFLHR